MMKKICFLLMLSLICEAFSQEKIGEYTNDLKENSSKILESFIIVNTNNKNIASFLLEKKNIYGYLIDSTFQIKKSLSSEDKRRKYRISLGKMFDHNDNYKVVVTDKNREKFALIHFNFNDNKVEIFEDKFNIKKLVFLQSISRQNKIHLLFLNRMTSNIISRTYDIEGNISNTTFNLDQEQFLIDDKREISLSKLITDFSKPNSKDIKNIAYELTKINEESYTTKAVNNVFSTSIRRAQIAPTSIETSVRYNKLYINEDDVIITLDKNRFYTQILRLNLNNSSYKFHKIKKPLFNIKKTDKRSNSFLTNNLLFTIASSNETLVVDIINFENNTSIKQLEVKVDKPIDFKNTPIIQKGGEFNAYRDFEKTKKFLRKISDSNIGIATLKNENGYEITIGSKSDVVKTTQLIATVAFGAAFGISASSFQRGGFFNSHNSSFTEYSRSKSVYIKCLFDYKFNHLKGDILKNKYDNISDFLTESNPIEKSAVTIFSLDDYLVLGAYSPKNRTYSFYKF